MRYPPVIVDNVENKVTTPRRRLFRQPTTFFVGGEEESTSAIGRTYPQAKLVIHRNRGVIHRGDAVKRNWKLLFPPDMGLQDFRAQR